MASAFGALNGRALEWGRPLAVLGVAMLALRLARPGPISRGSRAAGCSGCPLGHHGRGALNDLRAGNQPLRLSGAVLLC